MSEFSIFTAYKSVWPSLILIRLHSTVIKHERWHKAWREGKLTWKTCSGGKNAENVVCKNFILQMGWVLIFQPKNWLQMALQLKLATIAQSINSIKADDIMQTLWYQLLGWEWFEVNLMLVYDKYYTIFVAINMKCMKWNIFFLA